VRERPEIVQKMVAAFAEAINFVEKNPTKAKASIAKALRIKDEEALQVSYNVYTRDIVDRRMIVPGGAVADAVELVRASGIHVKRKPEDIYDNSFVNNLDKSGFLKELWGSELSKSGR
jgi:ABC-type nitrate/sulfonate/bicarbonate transport system substrate-binding protein